MLANVTRVRIILWRINVSNQHQYTLKVHNVLYQLYLNLTKQNMGFRQMEAGNIAPLARFPGVEGCSAGPFRKGEGAHFIYPPVSPSWVSHPQRLTEWWGPWQCKRWSWPPSGCGAEGRHPRPTWHLRLWRAGHPHPEHLPPLAWGLPLWWVGILAWRWGRD